ncbi:NmrA family NAD(P)-binding protein [Thioclava sp. GXIMD2076]|uniref:NmrA family NAD(P)-binding protein n=1 Tax=Thioclava sp. GXIMD2076 TaxID=3131931 RepID=UPI0030D446CD
MRYMVTGASGQLGSAVLEQLSTRVAKSDITALVRREAAATALAAQSYGTAVASYDDVEALTAAFKGVDRLLLISGSEVGQRARQHGNVVAAAKAAGVGFIAYTSLLQATVSPMILAVEHKATEEALAASGIPYALLRNGWYSENMLGGLDYAVEHSAMIGASGEGRYASAPRADYAEAAAIVLAGGDHAGKVYELAGDAGYTGAELAAMVAKASGKPVAYADLPPAEYKAALVGAGIPDGFADVLVDSSVRAGEGWLDDQSKTLSGLLGRPTEPMAETVRKAL